MTASSSAASSSSSSSSGLDEIDPPQTRKTRSLTSKNTVSCRTENAVIVALKKDIETLKSSLNDGGTEIAVQGREILALKKEIETLKSSITDGGGDDSYGSTPNDGGGGDSYGTPNDDDYAPYLRCTEAGDDAMSTNTWLDCCDGRKTELKRCRYNGTTDDCYICPTRDESSSCDNVVCNNEASDYCMEVNNIRIPAPYISSCELDNKYDHKKTPPCPVYTNKKYGCNKEAWRYCRGFRGSGLCYDAQKYRDWKQGHEGDHDDFCPGWPISDEHLICYQTHNFDPTKDLPSSCKP